MVQIVPFHPDDLPAITAFVQAIQDYERATVADLKPGAEIGSAYAASLLRSVAEPQGAILVAKSAGQAVGFVCAWIDEDDDPLLTAS